MCLIWFHTQTHKDKMTLPGFEIKAGFHMSLSVYYTASHFSVLFKLADESLLRLVCYDNKVQTKAPVSAVKQIYSVD